MSENDVPLSENDVLCSQEDSILTLQMNRPAKKNALTHAMYEALAQAIRAADQDPSIRCILMTGTEDCFTSGNDLSDFMASPPASFEEAAVGRFLYALHECTKPLVAAVNGVAIGIGTTMLLHCDLIYASENTVFQMPFANLGLCPEGGSSYLLPRLMGHPRAAELLLLGRRFSAREALDWGLINAVSSSDETLPNAKETARTLAAQPPEAIRLSKKMLKQSQDQTLRTVLLDEGDKFFARLNSPEAKEAFTAFAEKRTPDFRRFS